MTYLQWNSIYYGNSPFIVFPSVIFEITSVFSLIELRNIARRFADDLFIKRNGRIKNAVICGYHKESYRGLNTYYPIIEFVDKGRGKKRIQSREGMTFIIPKYKKGTKVRIGYIPDETDRIVIIPSYFIGDIIGIVIVGLIAVFSLICSAAIL